MSIELRPISAEELQAFVSATVLGFGGHARPEHLDEARALLEFDRSVVAFDGPTIVGTTSSISFDMTLPGLTTTPVAGVSWVTVAPTHRRQGILTRMMREQLAEVRAHGDALAVLLSSETVIYGRFGYGMATQHASFTIDPRHGALERHPAVGGKVRLIDRVAARTLLPAIHERERRRQPGELSRSDAWWDYWLREREPSHGDGGSHFYAIYEAEGGELDGYLAYRFKSRWEHGFPEGTIRIGELIAVTEEARTALWRYAMGIDLVTTVEAENCPVDDPIRWMLADPRRLRFERYEDYFWARLVDIPKALGARRYREDGRLVFEVNDPFLPENTGRYLLEGGSEGAECTRTRSQPDLLLEVADLSAAYLGGVRFSTLARAGRVCEKKPGALRRADRMFASEPLPWCSTDF